MSPSSPATPVAASPRAGQPRALQPCASTQFTLQPNTSVQFTLQPNASVQFTLQPNASALFASDSAHTDAWQPPEPAPSALQQMPSPAASYENAEGADDSPGLPGPQPPVDWFPPTEDFYDPGPQSAQLPPPEYTP